MTLASDGVQLAVDGRWIFEQFVLGCSPDHLPLPRGYIKRALYVFGRIHRLTSFQAPNKSSRTEEVGPIPLNDLNDLTASARWLHISPSQLRTLRREGKIPPPTMMLGKPLYTREQLEAIKAKALIQAGWHQGR